MTFLEYLCSFKKIINLAFHSVSRSDFNSDVVIVPDCCTCDNMVEDCCEDCGVCPFYYPEGF